MNPNSPAAQDIPASEHWAHVRERGSFFMMRLLLSALRVLPRPLMTPIVYVVTVYFFVFSRRARKASRDYLRRVAAAAPGTGTRDSTRFMYRHFLAFSWSIVDKLSAWSGRLDCAQAQLENYDSLQAAKASGRGGLLLGAHLGNLEMCRAIAATKGRVKLNVLTHTRHSESFSRLLRMSGASDLELLQVTEMDVATALMLKARIDRGEWVVITGDRVPVHGGRTVDVHLLGEAAPLPVGPYVLGALLECPVFLFFCLQRADGHHVYFEPFAERVSWQRSERDATLMALARRYAQRLEYHLCLEPLQWFNFYPFWRADLPRAKAP